MKKVIGGIVALLLSCGMVFGNFNVDTKLSDSDQLKLKVGVDRVFLLFEENLNKLSLDNKVMTLSILNNKIDNMVTNRQSDTKKYILSYLSYLSSNKMEELISLNGTPSVSKCGAYEHQVGDGCVSNKKSCSVLNGTGTQEWKDDAWGECIISECFEGFNFEEGKCVASTINNCIDGYFLYEGKCIENERPCTIENGAGIQKGDKGAWGKCIAQSCNSGYRIIDEVCVNEKEFIGLDNIKMLEFSPSVNDLFEFEITTSNDNITLSEFTFSFSGKASLGGGSIRIYRDSKIGTNMLGEMKISKSFKNGELLMNNLSGPGSKELDKGTTTKLYVEVIDAKDPRNGDKREIKLVGLKYVDSQRKVIDAREYDVGLPTATSSYTY